MFRNTRTTTAYGRSIATIALIVAFIGGGTATAAADLAEDSVGSKQIRDGSVRTADLAPNSVTSSKVADGSIRGADLTDGSVTGLDIDERTLGVVPKVAHAAKAEFAAKAGHAKEAGLADRAEHAETAGIADEARTAGQAQTANRLIGLNRAAVSATGELKQNLSVGAVSAAETDTPGRYLVAFDGPILGCFPMAGVAHNETARVIGSASAWIKPIADNPKLNQVVVETHVPGTAADNVPDRAPFSLLLICGG